MRTLAALHAALNEHDPHFAYDYSVDIVRPEVADQPGLVAAVQEGDGKRWVTIKVLARCAESLVERPVPLSIRITAEPASDLERDLEACDKHGTPFTAPTGTTDAEIALPGRLGGTVTGGSVRIEAPAGPPGAGYDIRLQVADPSGDVIAEALMHMQPPTTGPSGTGRRAHGTEQHGTFSFEMLVNFGVQTVGYTVLQELLLRVLVICGGSRSRAVGAGRSSGATWTRPPCCGPAAPSRKAPAMAPVGVPYSEPKCFGRNLMSGRPRSSSTLLPTLRRRAETRASRPRGRVPATMGVDAPGFEGDRPGVKDADWTLVWRVRAAVAAAPAGVTLGEEIEHVELVGAPVQVREVAAEKPLMGVREMVVVAAEPWVTVAVGEDSESEKSEAPVIVSVVGAEVCDCPS